MRVIMLSWEYPPKIIGGISRHVYDIAHALVKQKVDVHVITCEHPGAPEEKVQDGIHIYRVTPVGHSNDFIHWVQLLNEAMQAKASDVLTGMLGVKKDGTPKRAPKNNPVILHAHDWLAHYSATALKHRFHLPLIATIHATEHGRNNGIHTAGQHYINSVEWELQFEAWRVIVCSDFMRRECQHALGTPWEKLDVIYNGIDPSKFDIPNFDDDAKAEFRSRFAMPHEKLIFWVGRMVREKGVQILIEAMPKILRGYNDAKLVIVGGGYREHLQHLATAIGVNHKVLFTGFLPDEDLLKLYKVIDVACFPSLYEPFGIVALEAMAARVPVVVSDAGGLAEIVVNDVTGYTTFTNNSNSLADGILRSLHDDPQKKNELLDAAYTRATTVFNWDNIASQTISVYDRVWKDYLATDW